MKKPSLLFTRFLDIVERAGNFLPHPASLFALMALAVVVLSGIFASLELSVIHPSTGETIEPVSLLTLEGLHRMLTQMVTNFTGFAPLGTVFRIDARHWPGGIERPHRCRPEKARALRATATPHLLDRPRRSSLEHGERDRLRASGAARGDYLLFGGPAPSRRTRGRVRWCFRRLQRQPLARNGRPVVVRNFRRSSPARGPGVHGQRRGELLLHGHVDVFHRGRGNLGHRKDRSAEIGYV